MMLGPAISTNSPRRHAEAGVTLVEVLVVLVIVGVAAAALGLGFSSSGRTENALDRETRLLAIRLELAANDALVRGAPAGIVWDEEGYSFVSLQEGVWMDHPNGILGRVHVLDRAFEMSALDRRSGAHLIRPDMLPVTIDPDGGGMSPMVIEIAASGGTGLVVFDGVTARTDLEEGRRR